MSYTVKAKGQQLQQPNRVSNKTLKRLLLSSILFVFFALSESSFGYVYVYDVDTGVRHFLTVSKMEPRAYQAYNGGIDILYKIKVLKIYADQDFEKAKKDYGLDQTANYISEAPTGMQKPLHYTQYRWWR